MTGGILMTSLTYFCRKCTNQTEFYVSVDEDEDGFVVEGSKYRILKRECKNCREERVHVAEPATTLEATDE